MNYDLELNAVNNPKAGALPSVGLNVAIVGATTLIGQEVLRTLAVRHFPIETLKLLDVPLAIGSGRVLTYAPSTPDQRDITVQEITGRAFRQIDLAFFCSAPETAHHYIPIVADAGAFVIDVSGALRADDKTLPVVPEINGSDLAQLSPTSFADILQPQKRRRIVVSPDPSVIQLLTPLALFKRLTSIKRITVHTMLPVSEHGGQRAMEQLTAETKTVLEGRAVIPHIYAHQIAFNILPEAEPIQDNGQTKSEWRLVRDARRVWREVNLPIIATDMRVGVYIGQSQSVIVELGRYMSTDDFRKVVTSTPGLRLLDDTSVALYPQPWSAVGQDSIAIGRIRIVDAQNNAIAYFSTMDNVRKGAALNAVQIAETALDMKIV